MTGMSRMAERTTIAFTAARELDAKARDGVMLNVLTVHVPHADRYVTGACIGGDAFIGRWLYLNRPDAEHVVIVPSDKSRVHPWWLFGAFCPTLICMPHGSTYADRNARLVAESTCMVGFPAYPEDDPRSLRSGTWQAIRMARRAGKLSQWHCVTPPYRGRIERYARFFLADALGHSYPGIHVVWCRSCRRAWYDGDGCGCTCTDGQEPPYEDWVTDPDLGEIPAGAWPDRGAMETAP